MGGGILLSLGGLGLFLLGMAVMTDGLRSLAHAGLRNLLARSTRSPLSGAVTGALATAAIQSSSATTLAAIGFVGAGLLTFPEALGILFGANIGTTITGWLVALFGFKFKLGLMVLPLILVGALLRLLGKGKVATAGFALAGFGLIFVGIDSLQQGMQAFSDVITPQSFPPDTLGGRLLLVLIGLVFTLITQASGAGVAMAITAIDAGNITLAQGMAMVIGMDIGTTPKAVLASLGGSVQAHRTGMAHVIFNLMTGVAAFCLLTPYTLALEAIFPEATSDDPEFALVGFHSLFNVLGVVVVLPFTRKFAALVERLVPERGNPLTRRLDPQLRDSPDLAIQAVQATVHDLITALSERLVAILTGRQPPEEPSPEEVQDALRQTEEYVRFIRISPGDAPLSQQHQASIHILDHLRRLALRIQETRRLHNALQIEALRPFVQRVVDATGLIASRPESLDEATLNRLHEEYRSLKDQEKTTRREAIAQAAAGHIDVDTAITQTDAVRALRRIGYHVWRVAEHLGSAGQAARRPAVAK